MGKAYDFVLWLLPKVENFPRSHRFTIGERLIAHGLDVLVNLAEAACRRCVMGERNVASWAELPGR